MNRWKHGQPTRKNWKPFWMNKGDWIQALFIVGFISVIILLIYAWINWSLFVASGLTLLVIIGIAILFNKIRLL
jgi:hypothetical protein